MLMKPRAVWFYVKSVLRVLRNFCLFQSTIKETLLPFSPRFLLCVARLEIRIEKMFLGLFLKTVAPPH